MDNKKIIYGHLELVEFDSPDKAVHAAAIAAGNSAALLVPGTLYHQGNRAFLSAAMPLAWAAERTTVLQPEPGPAGSISVQQAEQSLNRPLVSGHDDNIASYLIDSTVAGESWFLPPVTLTVDSKVQFFTSANGGPQPGGYLVIPADCRVVIADGQHRLSAVRKALAKLKGSAEHHRRLTSASIGTTISFESELGQSRQDFADAALSHPLPASLVGAFDARSRVSQLCAALEREVDILNGRVEVVARMIPKASPMIVTLSTVRQMVKVVLGGTHVVNENRFDATAEAAMPDRDSYRKLKDKAVAIFNAAAEAIPAWQRIVAGEDPAAEVTRLRDQDLVCMTTAGWLVVARIAHELLADGNEWSSVIERLGTVDWQMGAPIWRGNIIRTTRNGGLRTDTSAASINDAIGAIARHIGWSRATTSHETAA
ncbi:MAG: DNA sulfur modification protein DndB [Planctomycetota bacterium]